MLDSTSSSIIKKGEGIGYMPGLGVIKSDNSFNNWTYREGKWIRNEAFLIANREKIYYNSAFALTINK